MNIDSITNGIVIDHITAGRGRMLYDLLKLDELDQSVAFIKNVTSSKMGRKDIIKIDGITDVDFDLIGYVDPEATVNIIKDTVIIEKKKLSPPKKLTNVLFCKNPRCITTIEQEIDHVFVLSNEKEKEYRCIYCETKA